MESENKQDKTFSDEIRELGENISELLKTAWDSPQRKEIQEELESGMQELKDAINGIAKDFSASDTGKQIKSEINEIKENISSGELERKVEKEILNTLNTINNEITNVIKKWSASQNDEKE